MFQKILRSNHSAARTFSSIEPLEARIAPASIITFTETDGDIVTLSISSGTLTLGVNVFLGPVPPTFTTAAGISEIDLNSAAFNGATLTVKVKAVPGGDGLVNIGSIVGDGSVSVGGVQTVAVDLKSISVQGDVGRVAVGTGVGTTPGLGSLTVRSLGVDAGGSSGGVGVQFPGENTNTAIAGNLGKLSVAGDIFGASIFITGNLGSATIGGSLIGANFLNSGLITTGGNAGAVKIGGSIIGGGGNNSGALLTGGNLASLTVGGDIVGGTGDLAGGTGGVAGTVLVNGPLGIGAVKIGGSILGNPSADNSFNVGGATYNPFIDCGSIRAFNGPINSLTVGGSIVGGAGLFGGYVQAFGAIGSVKVTGDIRGDAAETDTRHAVNFLGFNGAIQSRTSMGSVSVGGAVVGGFGNYSGAIFVGTEDGNIPAGVPISINAPAVTPGVHEIYVPNGQDVSGLPPSQPHTPAVPGTMGSVKIGGSVVGGAFTITTLAQAATGWIKSDGPMGSVSVGGDIVGGRGQYSGTIQSHTSIASLKVKGSIVGGPGFDSGSVFTGSPEIVIPDPNSPGDFIPQFTGTGIGAISIGGSLIAGTGNLSGTVYDDILIKSVTIGGNLVGDKGNRVAANLSAPGGAIVSGGALGPITIKGSIIGGITPGFGNIAAFGGAIASITVGHDIVSSVLPGSVQPLTTGIYSFGNLGPVKVGGSIVGAFAVGGEVWILSDGNIASVTVKGRVQNANITAGSTYMNTGSGSPFVITRSNPNASIGPVTVGGDWVSSNLVAGITSDFVGGLPFDAVGSTLIDEGVNTPAQNNDGISSFIKSVSIGGAILGTPADGGGDGYAFAAEVIGSLKQHGVAVPASFLAPVPGRGGLLSLYGDQDVFIFTLGGS